MVPRKQAGHMTCTRPQAERQILLAMRASSTHDPFPTSFRSARNPERAKALAAKNTRGYFPQYLGYRERALLEPEIDLQLRPIHAPAAVITAAIIEHSHASEAGRHQTAASMTTAVK
jgi:hypothetical protein